MPTLLLGAAGLSQKDVALSRRAEEQLEQERRDAELAARLQEEDEEAGKSTIKNVVYMQRKYSLHWVLQPASVTGVEVAKPNGDR